MVMAMLLTVVGVSLCAALVPVVTQQSRASVTSTLRTRALYAAQAGLEVAGARIRAATTASYHLNGLKVGDISKLPCQVADGQLDGVTSFEVGIDYLKTDPRTQLDVVDAVLDAWVTPNKIACTAAGTASAPLFALLRATGTADGQLRTLRAVYEFRTTNQDVAGGQIRVTTAPGRCVAVDPAVAGTNVGVELCDSTSASQRFAYHTDLVIALTRSDPTGFGLCLYAGPTRADGTVVRLQACVTNDAKQQWMFDNGRLLGTGNGTTTDGYCLGVSVAYKLVVRTVGVNCATFAPEPTVGTGGATGQSSQLVNFEQYGRCVELTSATVARTDACQQSDDPTTIASTQRWTLPEVPDGDTSTTGQILGLADSNSAGNDPYCLSVPVAAGLSPAVVDCDSAGTTWTRYGRTLSDDTRFQFSNPAGTLCLTPAGAGTADPDKLMVRACDGTRLQKWNADPDTDQLTALKSVGER